MSLCECGCGASTKVSERTHARRGLVKGEPLRFVNGHNTRLRRGTSHPLWKGDEAGYMAIHNWLRRVVVKSGVCARCGRRGRTDWANISGDYRRDPADYVELCRGCHVAQDRRRDPCTGRFL